MTDPWGTPEPEPVAVAIDPAEAAIYHAQVVPRPPVRCDVKSSSLPSREKRGRELSVLGDV